MRAFVLSVGSELLRGDIVDTNAAFLARRLSQLGFDVRGVRQVGDQLESLTAAVADALDAADLLVCTGGLGPTQDDLTRQAIAKALDESLFLDEALRAGVEARFASMGRRMPRSNEQQALLIPSATAIPNPNGTAPGWYVEKDGRVIVAMPGPPSEMQPMWTDWVLPRVERLLSSDLEMFSLMTFGLGESAVEERIADVIRWRPEVTVATYAKATGVEVHVTALASAEADAAQLAAEAERMLRERLGDAVFGKGDVTLTAVVGHVLERRGLSLGVMESATGGLLSSMITDHAGSSAFFLGGIVAYSAAVKTAHGVPADVIDNYGLISAETAAAMAAGVRQELGADVGLGVTGIAGSVPVEGKAPGTSFVAMAMDGCEQVREIRRPGSRSTSKHFFALCALDLLRRQLFERYGESDSA